MNACYRMSSEVTRRQWLETAACGFGALAFQAFAQQIAAAVSSTERGTQWHHAPRAKRVIFLFMHGGVSQVDSFDPKPMLTRYHGKDLPFKGLDRLDVALKDKAGNGRVLDTTFAFRQHGESGAWISNLWPHLAKHADDQGLGKNLPWESTLVVARDGLNERGAVICGRFVASGNGTKTDR